MKDERDSRAALYEALERDNAALYAAMQEMEKCAARRAVAFRALIAAGESQSEIARRLGIKQPIISRALARYPA